ncbi:MAG: CHAT domain-containing protein [Leptolyngbya sp. SIO4C1]|nr:CHAT domain-containing protein [Leptolyngbya sp. SIO4C1]
MRSYCLVKFTIAAVRSSALIGALAVQALPAVAQVVPTEATSTQVNVAGPQVEIEGGTYSSAGDNLFHEFEQFSLGAGQTATFLAAPAAQNIFGRIAGDYRSVIDGRLQVRGGQANLYLINPAGFLFGPNAALNLPAAFTATTAAGIGFGDSLWQADAVSYQAFTGSPTHFDFTAAAGSIINQGQLSVASGQSLALLGHQIFNTGELSAPGGSLTVAAVRSGQLALQASDGVLSLEGSLPALPLTPGSLPGWLTGADADHAAQLTVTAEHGAQLSGAALPLPSGTALISGRLSSASADTAGGSLYLLGSAVMLRSAELDASGTSGGQIRIGGDFQGQGGLPRASVTLGDRATQIAADALTAGDGGTVAIWADGLTAFEGAIRARGGAIAGSGGQVEISGKAQLIFNGTVDLEAPQGPPGTVLFDPTDIAVVAGSGPDDAALPTVLALTPGVFTLSEAALEALAGDANVVLQATNDITIAPLPDGALTFQTGSGAITFLADADSDGLGQFSMAPADTLQAAGRNLTISAADIRAGGLDTGISASSNNIGDGGRIELMATRGAIQTQDLTTASRTSGNRAGRGGDIFLIADGPITTGSLQTQSEARNQAGSAGSVVLQSTSGAISTGDLRVNAYAANNTAGEAGDIVLSAPAGAISAGQLVATAIADENDNTGSGGDVFLNAQGDITLSLVAVDSDRAAGVIDLMAGQTVRVLAAAPNRSGTMASLSAVGSEGSGRIEIDYFQNPSGSPFTVGDPSRNGTQGAIVTSQAQLSPPESIFEQRTVGDTLRVINQAVPEPPTISPPVVSPAPNVEAPDMAEDSPVTAPPQPEIDARQRPAEIDSLGSPQPIRRTETSDITDVSVLEPTAPPAAVAAWQRLEQSLAEQYRTYLGLPAAAGPAPTLDQVTTTLADVAAATQVKPALVYLYFSNDQLELMLITAAGQIVRQPAAEVSSAQFASVAQQFRQTITNRVLRPEQYLPAAQQLYQWLMAPIAAELQAQNIQTLTFILDDGLRSLPLAALHDGEQFLIERYSLGLMPAYSLSQIEPDRPLDSASILAMGIAEFDDQADLIAVPSELALIAKDPTAIFLNEAATLANLRSQLQRQQFEVAHIATHAVFQSGTAENSYLQLWDQRLRLDQLRQLGLSDSAISLLVLSACTTALGDQDAEFGFAGVALSAGVPSALASLWSVSDEATLGFMAGFYAQLNAGATRAEAVRQAQLAMLRGQVHMARGVLYGPGQQSIADLPELANSGRWDFTHPAHWSAFTMIGNSW